MPILSGGGGGAAFPYAGAAAITGTLAVTARAGDSAVLTVRDSTTNVLLLVSNTDIAATGVLSIAGWHVFEGDSLVQFNMDTGKTWAILDHLGADLLKFTEGASPVGVLTGALTTTGVLIAAAAAAATNVPRLSQVSPKFTITSGALPTVTLSSGTGAQVSTTRDVETVTPFSGDGTNNAATCAIALSPDNVTYSTLATIAIAAALNLTGVLTDTVNVRVPAGWYLKLTVSHGTIGNTTYY